MNSLKNIKHYVKHSLKFIIHRLLKNEPRFPLLTQTLTQKETFFRSPTMTPDLVKAIKLIAPKFDLSTDEESKIFWQMNQNASCWAEDVVISQYLLKHQKPKKLLEIGPGLGRSVVFLTKKYELTDAIFHLYERTGSKTKYTLNGPRFRDSFCGNIPFLRKILKYNQISNYKIFDAKKMDFSLVNLPGPYDIVYSFYAIGFHWNLELFFDDILKIMHKKSIAFFIVHDEFVPFEDLKKLHYKVIEYTVACPANAKKKMLVMSKTAL